MTKESFIDHNTTLFTLGEALWGFQTALVGSATVLAVVLREYGAREAEIGMIGAIEACGIMLPQLVGLFIFGSAEARKRAILVWHYVGIIPWLFVMGVLLVVARNAPARMVVWGLLGCYALFISGIGVVAGVWTDWIAHLFPMGRRGQVMGLSWGASALASVGGAFLAGQILGKVHDCRVYAWLYWAAGCTALASISVFWWVWDPAANDETRRVRVGLLDAVRYGLASLRHRQFLRFLVGRIVAACGFSIVPLIAIYYLEGSGSSVGRGAVVSAGAMLGAGFAVGNLCGGHLGDRWGHRWGIVTGVGLQIAALVTMLMTRGIWSCGAVYGLAGLSQAVTNLAHSNLLFETCPHDRRLVHITVGNIVFGIVASPLPFFMGWLAQHVGMRSVLGVSVGCSVVALVWLLGCVRVGGGVRSSREACK